MQEVSFGEKVVQMGKAGFLSQSNLPAMDVRNEDRYVIGRLAREPPIPILLMLRTVTVLIRGFPLRWLRGVLGGVQYSIGGIGK